MRRRRTTRFCVRQVVQTSTLAVSCPGPTNRKCLLLAVQRHQRRHRTGVISRRRSPLQGHCHHCHPYSHHGFHRFPGLLALHHTPLRCHTRDNFAYPDHTCSRTSRTARCPRQQGPTPTENHPQTRWAPTNCPSLATGSLLHSKWCLAEVLCRMAHPHRTIVVAEVAAQQTDL